MVEQKKRLLRISMDRVARFKWTMRTIFATQLRLEKTSLTTMMMSMEMLSRRALESWRINLAKRLKALYQILRLERILSAMLRLVLRRTISSKKNKSQRSSKCQKKNLNQDNHLPEALQWDNQFKKVKHQLKQHLQKASQRAKRPSNRRCPCLWSQWSSQRQWLAHECNYSTL